MGEKPANQRDWKFYTQIGVLVSGISGGLVANNSVNERVLRLEINSQYQLETIKELRDEVKSLKDELKARKVVGRIASESQVVDGNLVQKK